MASANISTGKTRDLVGQFAVPLREFLRTETASAGLLLLATLAALLWANVFPDVYDSVWHTEAGIRVGRFELSYDMQHWVNDGLMVFFFFVIGLELRRQLAMGELTERQRVTVPVIAALAGLALPALIFLAFNPSGEAARGWGVAMATDTAFVLGALALVGPRFPAHLRVFLLSLAVVDDIGALAAIAVFYSEDVSLLALAVAAACCVAIYLLGRLHVWRGPAYLVVGLVLWIAMVESGVHPTLGGVVVGLLISVYPPRPEEVERASALTRAFGQSPIPELARSAKLSLERAVSPNERLQELLHPWTSFVIVPVFAIANAGVLIDGELIERAIASPVTHGVVVGLVVGKLVGIGLATTLAVKLGLGRLPGPLRLGEAWGGAALAGIGFTVSLFVVDLAFSSEELANEARLGVLVSSVLAVALGWVVFRVDRLLARDVWEPALTLDPPVDPARDHIRGPVDAPLTLVEYGDYECPFCSRATGVVDELFERFGDNLRYVFRHLPLPDVHPHAELAAEAAEAAGAQGKFWEMHDELFAHQSELEPAQLLGRAAELGLDVERLSDELGTGRYAGRVREDVSSAERSGAEGTPTFFVNGRRLLGRSDAQTIAAALLDGHDGELPAGDDENVSERQEASAIERIRPAITQLRSTLIPEVPQKPGVLTLDGLTETPDTKNAFPRLDPGQIATLARFGDRVARAKGETVFPGGEKRPDFVVVLSGLVAMVADFGSDNRIRTVHGPGRFLGELGLLSGEPMITTPVAAEDSEVLIVPGPRLREALNADPSLDDLVLRTYLRRRALLLGAASELRLVGSGADPDTQMLRDLADRRHITCSFLDTDDDERAAALLEDLGVDEHETPVVITRGEKILRRPTEDEVLAALERERQDRASG
jgi:NhaA family Na+:H+ antiporter